MNKQKNEVRILETAIDKKIQSIISERQHFFRRKKVSIIVDVPQFLSKEEKNHICSHLCQKWLHNGYGIIGDYFIMRKLILGRKYKVKTEKNNYHHYA